MWHEYETFLERVYVSAAASEVPLALVAVFVSAAWLRCGCLLGLLVDTSNCWVFYESPFRKVTPNAKQIAVVDKNT